MGRSPSTIYYYVRTGVFQEEKQGWYRFIKATGLIRYVHKTYTDKTVARGLVAQIERALA